MVYIAHFQIARDLCCRDMFQIHALLDIWYSYREETDELQLKAPKLPEPPNVRERLKAEIKFFVENIREKAKRSGYNASHILQTHNSEVIDYALDDPSMFCI